MRYSHEKWIKIFQGKKYFGNVIKKAFERISISVESIENTFPGTHAVFVINGKYVIKIYWELFLEDFFVEEEILRSLNKNIYSGKLENFYYLIFEYTPGVPLRQLYKKGTKISKKILKDLAVDIKRIHQIDFKRLKRINSRNWESYFETKKENLLKKIEQYDFLSDKLKTYLMLVFSNLRPEKYKEIRLIHADLTEDHILVDDFNNYKGIIDFGDSMIAPVEYEWVALYLSGLNKNYKYFQYFLNCYGMNSFSKDNFIVFLFLHKFSDDILKEIIGEGYIKNYNELKSFLFNYKNEEWILWKM